MIKPTSPTSENKVQIHLVRWLLNRLEAAGNRLFAADDQRAAARGWQITPGTYGLSRRYRDPRFDTLISRPSCDGNRTSDRPPSFACRDMGRLTRPPPSRSGGGGEP